MVALALWWRLRQLKSSNPEARAAAAHELATSKDRRAVPPLIQALTDETPSVRVEAAKALGALPHPAAVEPLAAALEETARKARTRRPAADRGSEAAECEALATALGRQGTAAAAALVRMLNSEDKEARRWAAHALGFVRDPQTIAPLSRCLNDGRSEVRKAAAQALGAIGDAVALDFLEKGLANRDPETRRAIVEAIAAIAGESAARALAPAAEDENETVQLAAIEALRKTGGLSAGLALRKALEGSRKKSVSEAAAAALGSMSFSAANAGERAAAAVLLGDFTTAAREGEAAIDALIGALDSRDPSRRKQAAVALGSIRSARGARPLSKALRDYDSKVRDAAATALAEIGAPAFEALMECLESPDASVGTLAARALGRIGDPRAAGALAGAAVRNRVTPDSYPEPMETVQAAAAALSAILTRAASEVSLDDLRRISEAPDGMIEHPEATGGGARRTERAVDCAPIRELAAQEIDRRGRS